jgi:3-hydroxybutyryl-CoA dehydrogenase
MNNSRKEMIGVAGAGTMGSGIAQVAAAAGHDVLVFDANPDMVQRATEGRKKTFEKLVEKGKLTKEESEQIRQRIRPAGTIGDFKSCGLVIEAIVEQADSKQKFFSSLEKIVSEDCILASNTSSLSITSIASACSRPERFIGLHFFNPAPLMPLVEIIPGLATDAQTVVRSMQLISALKKTGVVAKDTPGFIVNRVARPFYGEAIRIFEEGWAGLPPGETGMATIDWAMKEIGGFRMGPFELMDLIGNDINYTVTETVWKQFFFDPRYKPSLTQKRLFESGRLGKKSGRGYYSYAPGASLPEPVRDAGLGKKIFYRILCMLINEAADTLYLRVAERDDIDKAMTQGVNYPKGLLRWCDEIGAGTVLSEMNALREAYAEERYRPSPLLRNMAENNRKFY